MITRIYWLKIRVTTISSVLDEIFFIAREKIENEV
jgi:hypothetical protein